MKKPILTVLLTFLIIAGAGIDCCAKCSENIAVAVYFSRQGEKLTVQYDIAGAKAILALADGKCLILPAAISASGSRYSDGQMTFWEHQGTAMLCRGEDILFEGQEAPAASSGNNSNREPPPATSGRPDEESLQREAIAEYTKDLKKTDKEFSENVLTDPSPCQLDAGKGKPLVLAYCKNFINLIITEGNWAAVVFVLAPVENKYKKMPVMADGFLYFLLGRDKKGNWRGVHWFLGSTPPSLSIEKMKNIGISRQIMDKLGWLVEEDLY